MDDFFGVFQTFHMSKIDPMTMLVAVATRAEVRSVCKQFKEETRQWAREDAERTGKRYRSPLSSGFISYDIRPVLVMEKCKP
jgi:hypothetical protein